MVKWSNFFLRIFYELVEPLRFLIEFGYKLCCKQVANPHVMAIVTREDIFPPNHGAAVKIFQTAKYLSDYYEQVYLITQSNREYFVFEHEQFTKHSYPVFAQWSFYQLRSSLTKRIVAQGIPQDDAFLFFPLYDKNFKFRLLYLATKYNISLYQAEFPYYRFACSLVCKLFSCQTSIVEHNVEFQRIAESFHLVDEALRVMKDFEIAACNMADYVITVSQEDKDILTSHGVKSANITVIPHGVDLHAFAKGITSRNPIRQQYLFDDSKKVLIFHGVLAYKPNYVAVQLLSEQILPLLNSRGYYPKCLIVGRYPPLEFSHKDIIFTDVVDELPPYLYAADIAVVPLLDGGGTRMKILEYFAAGIPVISTRKGAEGLRVSHGREIILADTMEQIVSEIIKMIEDDSFRRAIGNNGREFVQQFDWKVIAQQYYQLYSH